MGAVFLEELRRRYLGIIQILLHFPAQGSRMAYAEIQAELPVGTLRHQGKIFRRRQFCHVGTEPGVDLSGKQAVMTSDIRMIGPFGDLFIQRGLEFFFRTNFEPRQKYRLLGSPIDQFDFPWTWLVPPPLPAPLLS